MGTKFGIFRPALPRREHDHADSGEADRGADQVVEIGAIIGSAVPLALAIGEPWQLALLLVGAGALVAFRLSVVWTLLLAAAIGATVSFAGAPLPA